MATESKYQFEEDVEIDELVAIIDNSLSSDDEPSDSDVSPTIVSALTELKAMEKANRGQRLLEDELKLLMEHYKVMVKEKNAVIKEKNQIIEERNRFMNEKMRFIEEKNQMLEEKCHHLEEKKSEMRNNIKSLKHQLKEATGQNKKVTEERDQIKQERVDDQKRFDKEMNEIKEQLDEVGLVNEKDGEIEKLKKKLAETSQQTQQPPIQNQYIDWNHHAPWFLRNHLTHKIIQEVISIEDLNNVEDRKVVNYVAYVKKFESEMFKKAKSQLEYYCLMRDKKEKIKKNQKRLKQLPTLDLKQANHLNSKTATEQQRIEQGKVVSEQLDTALIQSTPASVMTANSSNDSGNRQEAVANKNNSPDSEMPNKDKKQDDEVVAIDSNKNESSSTWKVGAKVKVAFNNDGLSEEATIVVVDEVSSQIMVRFDSEGNESDEKKNRMTEKRENNDLKGQMENNAIEPDRKLIEEQDKLLKEQVDNKKPFEKELNEFEAKSNEHVKLLNNQIKILKQQMDLLKQREVSDKTQQKEQEQLQCQATGSSRLESTNYNPKKVILNGSDIFAILLSESPIGGVYLSMVMPDSPAAKAGLRVGDRLLEVNRIDLRKANYYQAAEALRQCGPTIQLVVNQWKKPNDDEISFKEELSEMKAQLDKQVELVKEKDREIENYIKETDKLFEERNQSSVMEYGYNYSKCRLKEAMERNNRLTEEWDQLKQKQIDDQKRFEKEMKVIKDQLEQVVWVKEKDDQFEQLKQTSEKLQHKISEQPTQQHPTQSQTKDWRASVSRMVRKQIADMIVELIIDIPKNQKVINFIYHVDKFESEMFEKAKSLNEYNRRMTGKINEIKNKLKKKPLEQSQAIDMALAKMFKSERVLLPILDSTD